MTLKYTYFYFITFIYSFVYVQCAWQCIDIMGEKLVELFFFNHVGTGY